MRLKVEYIPIDDLNPYEGNAKLHPEEQIEQIKESIKQFGFEDPIGIWGKDNTIVEGHGRLVAAKELGMKEVPVIRLDDLTDEQRRAYTLVHNKLTMNSDFDTSTLDEELLRIDDIDMSDFGFDDDFDESDDEVKEDDFDGEPPQEPITREKEVWTLGVHRVMCGDSTSVDDVEKLMGVKADLYLTDPPYNVDYTGKTKDALKIQNDKKDDEEFRTFLDEAFMAAKANMKAGAAFYIWHADSEGYNFRGACRDVDWKVRECLIWSKDQFVLGRQDYQWQHEPCLYGWNEGGSHTWYSDRKQTTVLHFERPKRSEEHPTMKPVALFDYLIKNSSKAGDIVLDSFGGSGTTIVACEQDGRKGYCMELDPKYVDVIVNRYIQLVGTDKDVFLNTDDGKKIPYAEVVKARQK